MMGISGATQRDVEGLFILLDIIKSPDKAKAILTNLADEANDAEARVTSANAALTALATSVVDLEAQKKNALDQIEKAGDIYNDIQIRREELAQATQDFQDMKSKVILDINNQTDSLNDRVAEFNLKVSKQEKQFSDRELLVSQREEYASKLVAEYTQKVDALKQLVI